jgi:uncharacterized membrane protein
MLFVHFAVGYGLTGSWQFGSALAIIDLVLGVLIYYYHDRFWSLNVMFGKEDCEQVAHSVDDHQAEGGEGCALTSAQVARQERTKGKE